MNSLILTVVLICQPPPDFSMFGEPTPKTITIVKEVPKKIYCATDSSGVVWENENKDELMKDIAIINKRLKKKTVFYYGKDRFGRDWRASSPEELQQSINRANAEQIGVWPQQRLLSPISGGSCAGGSCPPRG